MNNYIKFNSENGYIPVDIEELKKYNLYYLIKLYRHILEDDKYFNVIIELKDLSEAEIKRIDEVLDIFLKDTKWKLDNNIIILHGIGKELFLAVHTIATIVGDKMKGKEFNGLHDLVLAKEKGFLSAIEEGAFDEIIEKLSAKYFISTRRVRFFMKQMPEDMLKEYICSLIEHYYGIKAKELIEKLNFKYKRRTKSYRAILNQILSRNEVRG